MQFWIRASPVPSLIYQFNVRFFLFTFFDTPVVMNFYPVPPVIQAEIMVRIPDSMRCSGQPTDWRGGSALPASDIFLEGPVYTKEGNLYITDIPYGRILKVDAQKQVTECVRYDGEPNGLALREDGCMVIADYKQVCITSYRNRWEGLMHIRDFYFSIPQQVSFPLS
jgi:hypothetical protein